MPPKDAKKAAPGEAVEGEDPLLLLSNYQKYSKLIGIAINGGITKTCNDEENRPLTQLVLDDEFGVLGPGGTRALMTSIMGRSAMTSIPFSITKTHHFPSSHSVIHFYDFVVVLA